MFWIYLNVAPCAAGSKGVTGETLATWRSMLYLKPNKQSISPRCRRMSVSQCSGSGSGSIWSVCFYPPGSLSGSVIYLYGSGSFHQQAKKWRKTLIPTVLWLLYDFLSLKNDANVPSKRNKHKNLELKKYFLLVSWRSLTKRAGSESGSGSFWHKYGSKYELELPYAPYPQDVVQLELSMRGMIITLHCCTVLNNFEGNLLLKIKLKI